MINMIPSIDGGATKLARSLGPVRHHEHEGSHTGMGNSGRRARSREGPRRLTRAWLPRCRGRKPVIDTVEATGVASKAARLWPLLSIEG